MITAVKIPRPSKRHQLYKCPTGIKGLDEVTEGGLPKHRTTLICGSAGSGKTLLSIDFLIDGAKKITTSPEFSCRSRKPRKRSIRMWLRSISI